MCSVSFLNHKSIYLETGWQLEIRAGEIWHVIEAFSKKQVNVSYQTSI